MRQKTKNGVTFSFVFQNQVLWHLLSSVNSPKFFLYVWDTLFFVHFKKGKQGGLLLFIYCPLPPKHTTMTDQMCVKNVQLYIWIYICFITCMEELSHKTIFLYSSVRDCCYCCQAFFCAPQKLEKPSFVPQGGGQLVVDGGQ